MTRESRPEREILADGCRALGQELTGAQQEQLLAYVGQVYRWNRAAGLTNIPRSEAIRLHVLDSLAARPFVSSGPCLDLGTGAGLPGLVLAIAEPRLHFVLLESNRRRCSFLSETVRVLALRNVNIAEQDVGALPADRRFPVVISRAFRPPTEFLAIARKHVATDGEIIAMMAAPAESELRALADETGLRITRQHRFQLPGGSEARCVVSFAGASG